MSFSVIFAFFVVANAPVLVIAPEVTAPVSDDAARGADSGDATRAGAVDDVPAVLRGGGAGACCAICLESVTVAGQRVATVGVAACSREPV